MSDDDDATKKKTSPPTRRRDVVNASSRKQLRILTVGDGDFSLSLALMKCYNGYIDIELTATTLLESTETLLATYPQTAPAILHQLRQYSSTKILLGVDACFLHTRFANHDDAENSNGRKKKEKPFDVVLFHHPHLGTSSSDNKEDDNDDNEGELTLIQRHASLLAHYLCSAQQVAHTVHVALGSNQAASWRLLEAANRIGLSLCREIPVQHPFHKIFPPDGGNSDDGNGTTTCTASFPWQDDPDWRPTTRSNDTHAQQQQHGQQPKISRKQKRRHWLGRYGYQHVRTAYTGQVDPLNLAGSTHYVFERRESVDADPATCLAVSVNEAAAASAEASAAETTATMSTTTCSVCGVVFPDKDSLEEHIKTPALPSLLSTPVVGKTESAPTTTNDTETPPPTAARSNTQSGLEVEQQSNLDSLSSTRSENEESSPAASTVVLTVPSEYEGKRLRWFLQHYTRSSSSNDNSTSTLLPKLSKRQCEGWIKSGMVDVNGLVATDSGRILHAGWAVSVSRAGTDDKNTGDTMKTAPTATSSGPSIEILANEEHLGDVSFCVVWKPVGMRTIGSFDSSTLEETFTRQQQQQRNKQNQLDDSSSAKYKSLSKLDTGCSGLCVLQKVHDINSTASSAHLKVTHTFTILVHGRVPEEWETKDGDNSSDDAAGIPILLPVDGMRRWKKQKKQREDESSSSSSAASSAGYPARLRCLERATLTLGRNNNMNDSSSVTTSELSTVTVTTDYSESSGLAQTIAYYLRKTAGGGHAVVGDRFAVSEYLTLPRSIRNRIKQRLCMGCTSLKIVRHDGGGDVFGDCCEPQEKKFDHGVPEKWSATFWRDFISRNDEPIDG